jgi:hypothetical protein
MCHQAFIFHPRIKVTCICHPRLKDCFIFHPWMKDEIWPPDPLA